MSTLACSRQLTQNLLNQRNSLGKSQTPTDPKNETGCRNFEAVERMPLRKTSNKLFRPTASIGTVMACTNDRHCCIAQVSLLRCW